MSKQKEIDYTYLQQAVSSLDRKSYISLREPENQFFRTLQVSWVARIALFSLAVITVSIIGAATNSLVVFGIGYVAAAALLPSFYYQDIFLNRRIQLEKFAEANGMTYTTTASVPSAGMYFGISSWQRITEMLTDSTGVSIANLEYKTNRGDKERSHSLGFVRIPLSRHMPHIVLDARSNNGLGGSTNLPTVYRNNQRLSLEGDFDKYYNLYAPEQYKPDALYIFTPDVMAALIDSGAKYDIEIIDDQLFIYSRKLTLNSEIVLRELFSIIDTLRPELHDQIKRYEDHRVKGHEIHRIAADGRRLSQSVWMTAIAFGLAIAFFLIQAFFIITIR